MIGVAALAAPWLSGDPAQIDLNSVLAPPSGEHWLGTDGLGRDLAARVLHGARVSLAVGFLSALLALLAGIPLGAAAGYLGGAVDGAISRIIEAVLCFPSLLLLLALMAAEPAWLNRFPDVIQLAGVIALTAWIPIARYLRGEFLRMTGSDLVVAARASGAGHLRVVFRHLLPAALAPVLVTATFTIAGAITLEAAISFIGLGIQPPTPSWGGLLTEARHHVNNAWWLAVFPGLALFVTVLACNLAGEGLRDRLAVGKTAE